MERIVLGHTYADAAITPRFDRKVILSCVYDGIGKVGCLVIEGDQVYVLHRGTRLELPSDAGKDLLRYLKQAAALDPPPSSLQKRIAGRCCVSRSLSAKAGRVAVWNFAVLGSVGALYNKRA